MHMGYVLEVSEASKGRIVALSVDHRVEAENQAPEDGVGWLVLT